MTNKSPAYQWYPKDALASQRLGEMTLEEEGAYRRALDSCWLHGSIPADPERCARIIGKGCSEDAARVVLKMFVLDPNDDTRMLHDRLEMEREKQAKWREKSAEGGKAGQGKRKERKKIDSEKGGCDLDATKQQPNGKQKSTLQSSSSSPQDKPKGLSRRKNKTALPDDFQITAAMRSWAADKAPLITNVDSETEQFLDDRQAKNVSYGDWTAGWRTWMRNAQMYAEERKGSAPRPTVSNGTQLPISNPNVDFANFKAPEVPFRIVDDTPQKINQDEAF